MTRTSPIRRLALTAALSAALGGAFAAQAAACCFDGAITITPNTVLPSDTALDTVGPALPQVLVLVLILIAAQGGSGTG